MSAPDSAFYFDLASPLAYVAAEQVGQLSIGPMRWVPVLASELPGAESFEAFRCRQEQDIFRSEVERRASELQLQQLRWPVQFPFDSTLAMLVATYASQIGRVVPFALAAFRQAFAGGHDLAELDFVLIAAAACEMHPRAVKQSTERVSVREELANVTALAASAGVRDVPAVRVRERVFHGERALGAALQYARQPYGAGVP